MTSADTWSAFQRATERYQREPSAQAAASLLDAYSAWVADYVPEAAEILIAEFRDKLRRSRRAA